MLRTDEEFLAYIADTLAGLPGVQAVALGGSRAMGRHTDESDWDVAVYYRGHFEPDDLRAVGWPGQITDLGGWGGGIFNGGGWLDVDGRRVDVHYRDLDAIDRIAAEAERGEYRVEPLMFHLAGIPTYLLLAELAGNQVLRGELPRPTYPAALREAACRGWSGHAEPLFAYALTGAASQDRATLALGLAAQATMCMAHAICAAQGIWVTNEKRLLDDAGLTDVDRLLATAGDRTLEATVTAIRDICRARLDAVS